LALRTKVTAAVKERLKGRLTRHLPMPEAAASKPGEVEHRFIEPNLVAQKGNKPVRLSRIISQQHDWIFLGAQQSGKSSLLDYLGLKLTAGGYLGVPASFKKIAKPD